MPAASTKLWQVAPTKLAQSTELLQPGKQYLLPSLAVRQLLARPRLLSPLTAPAQSLSLLQLDEHQAAALVEPTQKLERHCVDAVQVSPAPASVQSDGTQKLP